MPPVVNFTIHDEPHLLMTMVKEQDLNELTKSELIQLIHQLKTENQRINSQRRLQIDEHESNLAALIENTDDYIVSVDTSYRILVQNTAYGRLINDIYGQPLQEGDHILQYMDERLVEYWKPYYEKVFAGIPQRTIETRLKGDEKRFLEVSFHPIMGKDQEIKGASIYIKDITERKVAEDQIRSSQQLLSSINRNIKEGIYRSTPEEGLIYVNKAFVEMFGYSSVEEVLSLQSHVLYDDPQRRLELISLIDESSFMTNQEVLYVRKDGTRFYGMTSSIMHKEEDGKVYFDGAIRDVTEHIEKEHQLRQQNEELIKVNSELDRFVYSTSHDLRAPLMSIAGLINISRKSQSDAQRGYYFDLMEKSIQKLDNFIKDIINFSRNARSEIEVERIEVDHLVRNILEELKYSSEYHHLKFYVEVTGSGVIYSDQKRLTVIFSNLLSNAARYSEPSREESFVKIHVKTDDEFTTIQIQDNGQGIRPEHMQKIFQMFYRGNNNSKGSGLGLYIVRETMEKLQGRITVNSEYSEGATFTLELPNLPEKVEA